VWYLRGRPLLRLLGSWIDGVVLVLLVLGEI